MMYRGKKARGFLTGGIALLLWGAAGSAYGENAKPAVTSTSALSLNGYTHIYYKHDGTAGVDTFQLRRARIGISGELAKNISYKFMFESAKSPFLLDAQVDVALSKEATIRIGQFKIPFSLENLTSGGELDTINRAQVVEKLVPGRDIGANGRDVGVSARVRWSAADLTAGLFNGSGINKADNDKHKDFGGRLVVAPFEGLKIGASLYDGEVTTTAGPVRRDRSGFEAVLTQGDFSFKGEYITAADGSLKGSGWYVQGGYFLVPKEIQAVVKFDSFDKNKDLASDRSDVLTIGVNWFFSSKTKLQINYERTRLETGKVLSNSLLAQFQAGF